MKFEYVDLADLPKGNDQSDKRGKAGDDSNDEVDLLRVSDVETIKILRYHCNAVTFPALRMSRSTFM